MIHSLNDVGLESFHAPAETMQPKVACTKRRPKNKSGGRAGRAFVAAMKFADEQEGEGEDEDELDDEEDDEEEGKAREYAPESSCLRHNHTEY